MPYSFLRSTNTEQGEEQYEQSEQIQDRKNQNPRIFASLLLNS